jgi:hypothetical protein
MDGKTELLRHTVATLAYRGGKALRGAPAEFTEYRADAGSRTPGQILAHMGDLMDWAVAICDGRHEWHDSPPLTLEQGAERFFAALETLDARMANGAPLETAAERIFQGPIADALTHVGQLAMLRRLSGAPFRGENYFKAEIVTGRAGAAQEPPRQEF